MSQTDRHRSIVVLLLPEPLEAFGRRALAEDLLRADGVVAVDPPRVGYRRQARWAEPIGVLVAQRQAKRLRKRLPGTVTAVVIFDPAQYRLARGLVAAEPGCALFYGPPEDVATGSEGHLLATERAAVVFDADARELRAGVADALAQKRT